MYLLELEFSLFEDIWPKRITLHNIFEYENNLLSVVHLGNADNKKKRGLFISFIISGNHGCHIGSFLSITYSRCVHTSMRFHKYLVDRHTTLSWWDGRYYCSYLPLAVLWPHLYSPLTFKKCLCLSSKPSPPQLSFIPYCITLESRILSSKSNPGADEAPWVRPQVLKILELEDFLKNFELKM